MKTVKWLRPIPVLIGVGLVVAAWAFSASALAQSSPYATYAESYPAEGVELGRGWYRTMGVPVARSCVSGSQGNLDSSNMSSSFTELTSRDQIYKALRINAAARYGAVKSSASFADTFITERNKLSVLAQVSYRRFGNYLAPSERSRVIEIDKTYFEKLSKASKATSEKDRRAGLREFFEACGDSYVAAIERGGDFLAQFTAETSAEERKKSLSAGISGGVGKFKASLAITSDLTSKLTGTSTRIVSTQTGGAPLMAMSASAAYDVLAEFAGKVTKENAAPFSVILQPFESHPDFPSNMVFLRTPPSQITYLAELAEKFEDLSSTYRAATVGRIAFQYPFQRVQTSSNLCKDLPEESKSEEGCLVAELADESRVTSGIAQCIRKVVAWCRGDIVCDLQQIPKDAPAAQCMQQDNLAKIVNEAKPDTGERSLRDAESSSYVKRITEAVMGNKPIFMPDTVALDVGSLTEAYLLKLAESPLVAGKDGVSEDIADVVTVCISYATQTDQCVARLSAFKPDAKELQPMILALRQWTLQERFGKTIGSACSIDPGHPLCQSLVAAVEIAQKLTPAFGDPRRFAGVSAEPSKPTYVDIPITVVKPTPSERCSMHTQRNGGGCNF